MTQRMISMLMIGLFLTVCLLGLSGCGETLGGIGKDTSRIYHGTKMIFFSDTK